MKKYLMMGLVVLLAIASVFAANNQKIYSVDSDIYKTISQIYVLAGHAVPSTSGPWSADELLKMYNGIDRNDVPDYLLEKYDNALNKLSENGSIDFKGGSMKFSGNVNAEVYAHTFNPEKSDYKRFDSRYDSSVKAEEAHSEEKFRSEYVQEIPFEGRLWWFGKDLTKVTPFADLEWETWTTDHFYTCFDVGLQNANHGQTEIGTTLLNTNIIFFQNLKFDIGLIDVNVPLRAFAAAGGDGWSIEIGRDRINWGSGATGNLVISDNFPFYDMARFSTYGEKYKYSYLLAFFPHKSNYYKTIVDTDRKPYSYYNGTNSDSATRMDGISFYAAHRFEGRFLNDKFSLAITEALTYASATNNIEILALSPMYFMHNAFMKYNSNSTLAFEFNATPIKGLGVYAQILCDDYTFPGLEKKNGPNKKSSEMSGLPDAYALLGGASYSMPLKGGLLTINPEVAYTSAFCYLRNGDDYNEYGLDYIAAVKSRLYSWDEKYSDECFDEYTIGYKYGPDCLTLNLAANWEGEKLKLGARMFYMSHGTHDYWTKWHRIPEMTSEENYKQYVGQTESHTENGNFKYLDAAKRNAKWITFDFDVNASYQLTKSILLTGSADFVIMKNVFNMKGQDCNDLQLILGAKYSY